MQQRFAQGYAGLNVCSWRLASRSTSTRRRSLRTATVPVAPGNRTAESDPAAADRSSPPPATPRAPPPPSAATLSPSRRSGRRLRARGLIRRRGRAGRLGGVDGQISQFRRGGPRLECHRPGDGGGARWRHGFVSAEHQRRTAGRDALRRVHAHEPRGHGDERRQRGQSFLRPEAAPAAAVFHHGPRSGRQRLAGGIHRPHQPALRAGAFGGFCSLDGSHPLLPGSGQAIVLVDTNAPAGQTFYRVGCRLP